MCIIKYNVLLVFGQSTVLSWYSRTAGLNYQTPIFNERVAFTSAANRMVHLELMGSL